MPFQCEAMVVRELGGPDVFEKCIIELPWPGKPDEVLVRLEAAAINPADSFFRALGMCIGEAPGAVLGHDGAGIIEAVGDDVSGFAPGERVCFCNGGIGGDAGTYAQFAVVPQWLLAKVPDNVDMVHAAATPLVFITGWESMAERANVQAGETVLVHGGAGGTGHIALQIAHELGARVAATVSSTEKADIVTGLGADIAINYREGDFVEAVRKWSGGTGVDVAYDNAGPEVFQNTLRALAPYGRIVTLMGTPADLEDGTAYNGNMTIHNVMMLTPMWYGLEDHRRRQGQITRRAMDWLGSGRLKINVATTYPLEQVAEAHRQLESGSNVGKIVLTIGT